MVNSNFYGLDAILIHPTTVQAARAANISYGALMFRRAIERQYLEPVSYSHTQVTHLIRFQFFSIKILQQYSNVFCR